MFSNLRLRQQNWIAAAILTGAAALALLAGCESRVGETPPPSEAYEFSGTQCLSSSTPVVKQFIQGTAQVADVHALWNCVGSAVVQFKKYVRGKTTDVYTSQEIATFLEDNFFDKTKKTKISPELQVELMKIKQLIVGGNKDFITRQELDKAVEAFEVFREVTVGLSPYMKVLALNWTPSHVSNIQTDMLYFEEANGSVQKAARTLAALFEKNGQTYALSDFVKLMEELSVFIGEDWEFKSTLQKYMPVVKKVKKALAGGNENVIEASEWRRFALLGSRGYVQYLRYYYFIKSTEDTGAGYRLAYLSRTVEDILSVFQDLTAQKPEQIVTRAEVTDLLTTLAKVWPDFKVSDDLVVEGMKIKQLLFGGSKDSFTTNDFNTARLKVSRLKVLIERFMPYWPIYGKEWDTSLYTSEEAQKFFMESQFILEATGRELGVLVEGSYDLKDLVKLAKAFEDIYPPKDPQSSLTKAAEKYVPTLIDMKKIILGGETGSLEKGNWSFLLGFGARIYTDLLYYEYFLKDVKWDKPEPLGNLSVLVNQSLNIFKDLIQVKENNKITRAELSIIAKDLIQLDLLPKGVDQVAADQVIKIMVNNVLVRPDHRIDGMIPNAINFESIEVLRKELQVWLDTEYFIAKISENWKPNEGLSPEDLLATIQKGQKTKGISEALADGLKEFALVVDSPVPLTLDSEGRLVISNKVKLVYNQQSLQQLNVNRALSRIAIRSFANDLDRIYSYKGVNLAEVQGAFKDLKIVFVQMGLLDKKNDTFGDSRFRDANLFTPHADGNSLASFQEMTDLVGMIWSGLKINTYLKKELRDDCLTNQEDPQDGTLVKVECARKSYKKAMADYMLATPEYLRFMKAAEKNDELDGYLTNIFKTAGYVPNSKKTVRWGDLSLAPQAVQYIEMLFARYDKNKDGYITTGEALKAYTMFKGLLLEFAADQIKSGSITEDDLPAIFCFMLYYGKPPETMKEKLVFFFKWKGKPEKWDIMAGRAALAQVLGYVADKTNKVPTAEIPNIDKEMPQP
ncbi:hypothetical protein [Bdellovibrio svalbardensis]|uniref:EF-hand domain-containing protein n=1 Tax=Bdellovibrio svalbardensis TaxID=2972972 RepID=A0ABT6DJX3_9BACT|nr:hypothetical protein [Bdellovibrio svalbardensis]MDG0816151.1 hypothetical protein [Bdellovibrio svalbardensis]